MKAHLTEERTKIEATLKSNESYLQSIENATRKLTHDQAVLIKQNDQLKGALALLDGLIKKCDEDAPQESSNAPL